MISTLVITQFLGVNSSVAIAADETASANHRSDVQPKNALRTLDDHFPFDPPATANAWRSRREALKLRVAIATGLFPMPDRGRVDAVIHSPLMKDGFRVEKVYFESLPGHFVTGLLFRPDSAAKSGTNRPAVLCPHGHAGRLQRHDAATMAELIQSGDERFADSGSMPKIARCAHLARMGCVVFIFDMLGYADSQQLSHELVHDKHQTRPGEGGRGQMPPRLFYSTAADARLQSVMGLQIYNALRSLDFLASLPDVDPTRIGVTGGSGGGTQTILLGALDDRVAVSFPNGMVSTSMQGGCTCENCCYLRIGTGNVELAALVAPKPLAMTAADDWTRDMMSDGYPQLQQLYQLLGAREKVFCEPLLQFDHNYNYVSRSVMYRWMNEHLDLGFQSTPEEPDFQSLTPDELTVWNAEHPRPKIVGEAHELEVLSWWDHQSQSRMRGSVGPAAQLSSFDELVPPALRTIYDVDLPEPNSVELRWRETGDLNATTASRDGVIVVADAGVPVRSLRAKRNDDSADETLKRSILIWVTQDMSTTDLPALVQRRIDEGHQIIVVGLGPEQSTQPMNVDSGSQYTPAVFTFAYNRPKSVQRCGTILNVIAAARSLGTERVELYCDAGFAAAALPAAAIAAEQLDHAIIAINGFRFGELATRDDIQFVPGMVKYGDIDAWAAARAPHPLTIVDNKPADFPTARRIYQQSQSNESLRITAEHPMD